MRLLSWNLENFFLYRPTYSNHFIDLKDSKKIEQIAQAFIDINPDVAFLTEVGGIDSLDIFNKEYLNNQYIPAIEKGNSNRAIEIGYLLKKDFLTNHHHKLHSHKRSPINFLYPHEKSENKKLVLEGRKPRFQSHHLSRDLSMLEVFNEKNEVVFIVLGVHLKSKLDKEGYDWQGQRRRSAECEFIIEKYLKLYRRHHNNIPIILTGDFNANAQALEPDAEMAQIYVKTDLTDFADALKINSSERISYTGIDRKREIKYMQLDYFFMDKKWTEIINKENSGFYRYKNEEGGIYPLATNPGSRHALMSDHYPIVLDLKI